MKNLKRKLLMWLLKDEKTRKIAVIEVIGDVPVNQYALTGCKDVVIENCFLINSTISDNRISSMTMSVLENCMFTSNIARSKEIDKDN